MKLFVSALLFLCTVSCARLGANTIKINFPVDKNLIDIVKDNTPRTFVRIGVKGEVYEIITDYRCLKDEDLKEKLKNGPVKLSVKHFNDGRKLLTGAKFISKQYYEDHIDKWGMVIQGLKEVNGFELHHRAADKRSWISMKNKGTPELRSSAPCFKDLDGTDAQLTFTEDDKQNVGGDSQPKVKSHPPKLKVKPTNEPLVAGA